jgi:hypothetical protein
MTDWFYQLFPQTRVARSSAMQSFVTSSNKNLVSNRDPNVSAALKLMRSRFPAQFYFF